MPYHARTSIIARPIQIRVTWSGKAGGRTFSVELLDPRVRESECVRPVAERAMEGDFLQFQVGQYVARELDAARDRFASRRAQQHQ